MRRRIKCAECGKEYALKNYYKISDTMICTMCKKCIFTKYFRRPIQSDKEFLEILQDVLENVVGRPYYEDLAYEILEKYGNYKPSIKFAKYLILLKTYIHNGKYPSTIVETPYTALIDEVAKVIDGEDEDDDEGEDEDDEIDDKSMSKVDGLFKEGKGKIYSKEWMGWFTPEQLEYLENYYNRLVETFTITNVNHEDYARKVAKASLAMELAYQDVLNGIEGAEKRYKELKDAFDKLSTSAKFSESTRSRNDVGLGCFGRVFEAVERKTWIPEHKPLEKDEIDKLIDYFRNITRSL